MLCAGSPFLSSPGSARLAHRSFLVLLTAELDFSSAPSNQLKQSKTGKHEPHIWRSHLEPGSFETRIIAHFRPAYLPAVVEVFCFLSWPAPNLTPHARFPGSCQLGSERLRTGSARRSSRLERLSSPRPSWPKSGRRKLRSPTRAAFSAIGPARARRSWRTTHTLDAVFS
jgi:hypothetical protein